MPQSTTTQSNEQDRRMERDPTTASAESATNENTLDFIQALNTALCFLCWVNADSRVVDSFLKQNPEALLFEGTSQDSCAHTILEQRIRRCCCVEETCNKNRQELVEILNRGYGHYQDMHIKDIMQGTKTNPSRSPLSTLKSTFIFPRLMATSRYLRSLSHEESAVRSQVLELHVAKVSVERELEKLNKSSNKTRMLSRIRSLVACANKARDSKLDRLAFELEVAQLKLDSAEKEHNLLVQAIDQGHRNQYDLLRNALGGFRKHDCASQREGQDIRTDRFNC